MLAVGVPNNDAPIPSMRGVDGASWNNKRLDGVVLGLQVRKHLVELHTDDPNNIFTNDPRGPDFRYNSEHFRPEETVVILAFSLPGSTKRLAWEASRNNVNCS
jgi:hypothetical protein